MRERTDDQLLMMALDDEINQGNYQAVQELLRQGVDVNGKDVIGNTPLMNAVWVGASDIVRLLIEHGAKLNILDGQGKTALQLGEEIEREGGGPGHNEAIRILKATDPELSNS